MVYPVSLREQIVAQEGLEPSRQWHGLLRPACLPIPPPSEMLVTKKGLEPPRLSAPDPKSDVSTNSTTRPLVPPLRAARSYSDFQSGPITGFGLRGKTRYIWIQEIIELG